MGHRVSLDFILSFCKEKVPGHGEDSYCYSFCDTAGLLGAFDGCGGAGARTHSCYSDHTEAYMASRICAGAFYDCFRSMFPGNTLPQRPEEVFLPHALERLKKYSPPKDENGFQIRGSSIRTLPTTAAVALIQPQKDGSMLVTAMWAGDSRVYILDADGLAQLTVDDTTVTDPMINIYEDGILKNVMCSDKPVRLHCTSVRMHKPFVVFSATDGCFGYLSTPMEFEGLFLETLSATQCAADWERVLSEMIGSVAGDDHTLCLAAYGFGSYAALQGYFADRLRYLKERYLRYVEHMPLEDRESRFKLWETYRDNYMRYAKGGDR